MHGWRSACACGQQQIAQHAYTYALASVHLPIHAGCLHNTGCGLNPTHTPNPDLTTTQAPRASRAPVGEYTSTYTCGRVHVSHDCPGHAPNPHHPRSPRHRPRGRPGPAVGAVRAQVAVHLHVHVGRLRLCQVDAAVITHAVLGLRKPGRRACVISFVFKISSFQTFEFSFLPSRLTRPLSETPCIVFVSFACMYACMHACSMWVKAQHLDMGT